MTLPPLANFFAFRDPDPASLQSLKARVNRSGRFVDVVAPASDWLLAVAPLPGAQDGRYKTGLAFAEGADLFDKDDALRAATLREPQNLDRFDGDFTFALFAGEEIRVVRSGGGLAPVYLYAQGGRAAIATRLTDLAAFTPTELELDPLVHATWMTGFSLFPYNRTFFRNVSILPRGHYASWRHDYWNVDAYWDPRPLRVRKPTPEREREHVDRFRSIVLGTLDRELSEESDNLVTLSGGVDSSTVASVAAGVLGRPVSTLSFVSPNPEPSARAGRFLDNVVEAFPIRRSWRMTMGMADRLSYLREAPLVTFPVIHPALGVLGRIKGQHPFEVLCGGEFADEVAGSTFTLPDWARHTSLLDLVRAPGRWPLNWKDPARWVRFRLRRLVRRPVPPFPQQLSGFVVAEVREEYSDWRAEQVRRRAADRRALIELDVRTQLDGFVAMNWEVASEVGVRRSLPFFNRAMLELAFDCHPGELIGPGTKKLIRAAFRDDVPHENLFRADRGHWKAPPEAPLPLPERDRLPSSIVDLQALDQGISPLERYFLWSFARFQESFRKIRGRNNLE